MGRNKSFTKGNPQEILNSSNEKQVTTNYCYADLIHSAELLTKACSKKPLNIDEIDILCNDISIRSTMIALMERRE